MYKPQFIRQLTASLHIKNSKYQKGDIAQQYIDTYAMSCCVISLF